MKIIGYDKDVNYYSIISGTECSSAEEGAGVPGEGNRRDEEKSDRNKGLDDRGDEQVIDPPPPSCQMLRFSFFLFFSFVGKREWLVSYDNKQLIEVCPGGILLQYVLNFVDIRKADNKREDIRIENLLLFVNYKTQGL